MSSSTSDSPQILTIGFGALGTLYSFILQAGGAQVTAVARSNYDVVSQHGITVNSGKFGKFEGWKPTRVVKDPETARDRVYDYVLCTSKCTPDYVPLSSIIRPFLATPSSSQRLPTIVLIQNGVGIEDEVYQKLVLEEKLAGAIISCCAWVGCNLVDGGKRIEHGSLERLEMGLFPTLPASSSSPSTSSKSGKEAGSPKSSTGTSGAAAYSPSAEEAQRLQSIFDSFVSLYKAGGGGAAPVPDIQPARWRKLLWNASWGGLCALSRQPVGALINEGSLHFSIGVVRRTMLEVLYVARACGYGEDVFPASAVDEAIKVTLSTYMPKHLAGEPASAEEQARLKRQAEESISEKPATVFKPAATTTPVAGTKPSNAGLSPDFKPSILLDLEAGRPMETVPIFESVIERARLHGMETPRLDLIMASLRPSQVAAIDNARRKQASAASEGTLAASTSGGSVASAAGSEGGANKGANSKNLSILSSLTTPLLGPGTPLLTPKFRPGGVPVPESLKDGYF